MRVMKFLLGTKDFCLKIKHIYDNEECNVKPYSDRNQARNSETRIIVTVFIINCLVPQFVGDHRDRKE
jgi:hypothetical protein